MTSSAQLIAKQVRRTLLPVAILVVILTVLMATAPTLPAGSAASPDFYPSAIPAPARLMAAKLGIQGPGWIGSLPNGRGGPWTMWGPTRARDYLYPKRRILFVGPEGAKGPFYYADPTVNPRGQFPVACFGTVPRRVARSAALAWLHKMGVRAPTGRPLVTAGGDYLGLILRVVDFPWQVWWGSWRLYKKTQSISSRRPVLFISCSGKVAEVDSPYPQEGTGFSATAGGAHTGSHALCPQASAVDSNGVRTGTICFAYAAAAGGVVEYQGLTNAPTPEQRLLVQQDILPISGRIVWRDLGIPVEISSGRTIAVWAQPYRGMLYRLTFRKAFPVSPVGWWELSRVLPAPFGALHYPVAAATGHPPCPLRSSATILRARVYRDLSGTFGFSDLGPWKTVATGQKAEEVYVAFCTLPRLPYWTPETIGCTMWHPAYQDLSFYADKTYLVSADVSGPPCGDSLVSGGGRFKSAYQETSNFPYLLSSALRLPPDDL